MSVQILFNIHIHSWEQTKLMNNNIGRYCSSNCLFIEIFPHLDWISSSFYTKKWKIFPLYKLLISVSGCSLSSVSSRRSSSRMPMQEFTGKYVTHTKHKAVFNLNQLSLFWRLCSRETWKDLIPFSFLFKENLKRWFGEFLLKCTWTRHMYLKVFHDPLRPNFYKAVTKGCGSS